MKCLTNNVFFSPLTYNMERFKSSVYKTVRSAFGVVQKMTSKQFPDFQSY